MSSINSNKGPSELPPQERSKRPDLNGDSAETSKVKAVGSDILAKLPKGGVLVENVEPREKFTPVEYGRFSPSLTEGDDKFPSSLTPQARTSPKTESPLTNPSTAKIYETYYNRRLGQEIYTDDKFSSSPTPQRRTSPEETKSPLMKVPSPIGKDKEGHAFPSSSTDRKTPLTSSEEGK